MAADAIEELLPSEVRVRILREHTALRATMDSVEAREASEDLRGAIERLLDALGHVVEVEHDLLLPTLRTIDAWGAERARRVSAWHIDLRERMERMRCDAAALPPPELAARARELVAELRADLAAEERQHLAREIFRELPIPTDIGGD